MAILRGLIVARTTGSNVGRWLYNMVVVPTVGKPKKAYKTIKLPLNTEKLIELLFRCLSGRDGGWAVVKERGRQMTFDILLLPAS